MNSVSQSFRWSVVGTVCFYFTFRASQRRFGSGEEVRRPQLLGLYSSKGFTHDSVCLKASGQGLQVLLFLPSGSFLETSSLGAVQSSV